MEEGTEGKDEKGKRRNKPGDEIGRKRRKGR